MAVKEKLFFKKRKRIRPEKKRKDKSFSVKYQIENISSFVTDKTSVAVLSN